MAKHVPGERPDQCKICYKPLRVKQNGRPRQTCSEKCRKALQRRWYDQTHYDEALRREWRRDGEQRLRAWEREFGRLDETKPQWGGVTLRERLMFRMERLWEVSTCLYCHRPYIRETRSAYCSIGCRDEAKRRREAWERGEVYHPPEVERRCGWCRGAYAVKSKQQRYCSDRCRKAAWRARRKTCPVCGAGFTPVGRNAWQQKFCSDRCRKAAWRAGRREMRAAL